MLPDPEVKLDLVESIGHRVPSQGNNGHRSTVKMKKMTIIDGFLSCKGYIRNMECHELCMVYICTNSLHDILREAANDSIVHIDTKVKSLKIQIDQPDASISSNWQDMIGLR